MLNKQNLSDCCKWSSDLVTGIADIDEQHRAIFKIFEDTLDDIKNGADKANSLEACLTCFIEYASEHFKIEENYMISMNWVHAKSHKKEHDRWLKELTDIRDGPDSIKEPIVQLEVILTFLTWFKKHIHKSDAKFVKYLKSTDRVAV